MAVLCFKCKKSANIKINVLKYCNECFQLLFESKLKKALPKIHPDASIFVYLRDFSSSQIIVNFLEKNFQDRPIKKIECYVENGSTEIKNELFSKFNGAFDPVKRSINTDMIQYCRSSGFAFLFYGESLNETVLSSLFQLCHGEPEKAIELATGKSSDGISIINLFSDIKQKELVYYMYLNKMRIESRDTQVDPVNRILNEFLNEVDEKNGLTFFNIKNTFEKLKESRS